MALIRMGFFSQALGMCTSCNVILPQQPDPDAPARTFPVLYLLHPIKASHSSWQRMTAIEYYAAQHGVVVIMPDAHLSSYTDMAHGGKYFTYIADELPEIMKNFFPISDKREETFICGASCGGYGALKIGLRRPERFGAAGSLSSGFTSFRGVIEREDDRGVSMETLIFGSPEGTEADDIATAEAARAAVESGENIPRIFITCGQDDEMLIENCREAKEFFESFEGDPFDFCYTEHPGGHNWGYWDEHICDFMQYAGLEPGQPLR